VGEAVGARGASEGGPLGCARLDTGVLSSARARVLAAFFLFFLLKLLTLGWLPYLPLSGGQTECGGGGNQGSTQTS
jgi:hypothetical protein